MIVCCSIHSLLAWLMRIQWARVVSADRVSDHEGPEVTAEQRLGNQDDGAFNLLVP
jgi:hypothetical protein